MQTSIRLAKSCSLILTNVDEDREKERWEDTLVQLLSKAVSCCRFKSPIAIQKEKKKKQTETWQFLTYLVAKPDLMGVYLWSLFITRNVDIFTFHHRKSHVFDYGILLPSPTRERYTAHVPRCPSKIQTVLIMKHIWLQQF